jgi:hypothetical protein
MGKPSEERPPVNPFDSPYDQEIQPVTSQYAHSETSTLAGEDEWPKGGVMAKGDEMQSQDGYENPENPDLLYAQEILEEQLYCPTVKVGYRTLFKYASRKDIILVWISIICAVLTGASVPMTNVSPITKPLLVLYRTNSMVYHRSSTVTFQFNSKSSSRVISMVMDSKPHSRTMSCTTFSSLLRSL